ncbi:MAG: hypothetical protein FVQ81_09645 [Candidatus Glassbacteria bacterium]|nr:hypothetical protein [Candidatus Glassbacteria bacterium]
MEKKQSWEDQERKSDEKAFQRLEETVPLWRRERIEWLDRAFRHLTIAHFGGLASMLAFAGAMFPLHPSVFVLVPIAAFGFGIVAGAGLLFLRWHLASVQERSHRDQIDIAYDDETMSFSLPPRNILEIVQPPSEKHLKLTAVFLWVMFILLIAGFVVGAFGFLMSISYEAAS